MKQEEGIREEEEGMREEEGANKKENEWKSEVNQNTKSIDHSGNPQFEIKRFCQRL